MEILIAIDDLDDLIHASPNVPLSDQVRIDAQALRSAVERIRPAATELFGLMPERTGPIGDVFAAIDDIEALAGAARPIPLTTQVRVDRFRAYDLLDRLRADVPAALIALRGPAEPRPPTRWSEARDALDALDDLVHGARPAWWAGDWLRVDSAALRDASHRMRVATASAIGTADDHRDAAADLRAAIDELDSLAAAARRIPLTSDVRVPREPLYDLLDRMRGAVSEADAAP